MSGENTTKKSSQGKLKSVFLVYNQAMDEEVLELLDELGIVGFTKWTQVLGRGKTSGSHFGTEVWPGANNAIFIAVGEVKARELLEIVQEMRQSKGHEGVKAFLMPLEEMT